jgi:hypothetical protein
MSKWFQDHNRHSGRATVRFRNPQGSVTGEGFAEISERGSATIQFRVDEYELQEATQIEEGFELAYLLHGAQPFNTREGSGPFLERNNVCDSFELESPEGTLRAGGSIAYIPGDDDDGNHVVSVFPQWLQFDALIDTKAIYWAMPLSNLIANFLQSASSRVQANPLRLGSGKYDLIEYEFEGSRAFIERVPDYDLRVGELREGRAINRITSVMVGEVGVHQYDSVEALEQWIPLHLLGVLGLVTGSEVGAPWIDLRDDQGQLVRRFYPKALAPIYVPGYAALQDTLGFEKVGLLLTAASHHKVAQKLNESYLRVAMKLMVRAKLTPTTLEDKLANISRAVDSLCERFDLKEGPNVKSILDDSQNTIIKRSLKDTANNIRNMAISSAEAGNEEQADVLERIANNVSDARTLYKGYGKAVVALLEKFDLPDEKIVSSYIAASTRYDSKREKSFAHVVSRYRGQAIHVKYLGVTMDKLDKAHNAVVLVDHIHDILLRIVFKIIGYSGTYNPTVLQHFEMKPINWVRDTTTARELGYERFD